MKLTQESQTFEHVSHTEERRQEILWRKMAAEWRKHFDQSFALIGEGEDVEVVEDVCCVGKNRSMLFSPTP